MKVYCELSTRHVMKSTRACSSSFLDHLHDLGSGPFTDVHGFIDVWINLFGVLGEFLGGRVLGVQCAHPMSQKKPTSGTRSQPKYLHRVVGV